MQYKAGVRLVGLGKAAGDGKNVSLSSARTCAAVTSEATRAWQSSGGGPKHRLDGRSVGSVSFGAIDQMSSLQAVADGQVLESADEGGGCPFRLAGQLDGFQPGE